MMQPIFSDDAPNLIRRNEHFGVLDAGWRLKRADARDIRVRVGGRFCRIAFQMVAGQIGSGPT